MLLEQYEKYKDYLEHIRYAPRMTNQKHVFVVKGVHEEIHQHLSVIKEENEFTWTQVLQILLMTMETELDRIDAEEYKERSLGDVVRKIFPDKRFDTRNGWFSVHKTKLRREYDKETQKYRESGGFKELSDVDDFDSAESYDFLDD